MKILNSNIQEYIDIVRGGEYPVCIEQLQLCDYVERVFENEDLFVDEEKIKNYFSLEKYFPFKLFPWEKFVFVLHNCVFKKNGQPRWKELFIYGGRGLGKNGYIAFEDFCLITPYHGVKFYHIDICATSEEQAKTSFDDVYNICEENKKILKKHFHWNKECITNLQTKSQLRYRTNRAESKDGGRQGKVDFDEYHAYLNNKMINVFKTGLGKKAHPRITITTTDGDVRDGPLDKKKHRAKLILKGEIPDGGMLPFMCKLDTQEEVYNKLNWHKANPSLRYLPTLMSEIEEEYLEFVEDEYSNSSFLTKRMNIPQGDKEVQITSWENILETNKELPPIENGECVIGIDFMKITDFCSVGALKRMDNKYYWYTHTWVCKKSQDLKRIQFPLDEAQKKGLLTMVDDVEIPMELISEWIVDVGAKTEIKKVFIDNFRFSFVSKSLRDIGFISKGKERNIILVRPSDIMKIAPHVLRVFEKHEIIMGDNMLMRWFINNAKQEVDSKGNITFGKIEPKSRKTDGFMALVHAFCGEEEIENNNNILDLIDLM